MANKTYDELIEILRESLIEAWQDGQRGERTPGLEESSTLAYRIVAFAAGLKGRQS